MAKRDQPIPVEDWWLTTARDLLAKELRKKDGPNYNLKHLGISLSKKVSRPSHKPWGHSVLSRLIGGDPSVKVTYELALAVCAMFPHLPLPVFVARSLSEAVEMAEIAARYDTQVETPLADDLEKHRQRQAKKPARVARAAPDRPARSKTH